MSLKSDLEEEVASIFQDQWSIRDGKLVPEPEDLLLGNDAVELEATVLYADIDGSTKMVDTKTAHRAAELYKSYMVCAARILKSEGGSITAYDGDRIMAVFIGKTKNSTAAKAGLMINWALKNIVNEKYQEQYNDDIFFELRHKVGIDTSSLFACRIGVRNDNDLVWVGRAANHAAKLTAIPDDYSGVYMTKSSYDQIYNKLSASKQPMWEERNWNSVKVYRSNWTWKIE